MDHVYIYVMLSSLLIGVSAFAHVVLKKLLALEKRIDDMTKEIAAHGK